MAQPSGYPITGVAYVSQIEHEYMNLHKLSVCSNCFALGFDKQLKRCNGCRCQKKHWPKHKGFCDMVQGKGPKNTFLSRCQTDKMLRILLDSYRLRVELDHVSRGEDHGMYYPGKWEEGLVWAKGDAVEDFQRYLDLAEASGVLPKSWRFEDRMQCLSNGVAEENEENIFQKIDQEQLVTKYEGDISIRNALCVLAELVVGYEGKGPAKDGKWFQDFQEYLDLHPQARAKLIQGTVEAVQTALEATKDAPDNTSATITTGPVP